MELPNKRRQARVSVRAGCQGRRARPRGARGQVLARRCEEMSPDRARGALDLVHLDDRVDDALARMVPPCARSGRHQNVCAPKSAFSSVVAGTQVPKIHFIWRSLLNSAPAAAKKQRRRSPPPPPNACLLLADCRSTASWEIPFRVGNFASSSPVDV